MQVTPTDGNSTSIPVRKEMIRRGMGVFTTRRLLSIISPIIILLLWQVFIIAGILDSRFFPAPIEIVKQGYEDILSGQLISDLKISLIRILVGLLAGAIPGVLLGLSAGLFKPVRYLLDPIVAATYPIPKMALMPLLMLIFGLDETEKYILLMLAVIFPVFINTAAGVLQLDKRYLDVAKDFGASRKEYYTTVALPGSLPMIFTGLKLGLGMALLFIMPAEMEGASSGIGYRIWISYSIFQIKDMYVSLIAMALMGFVFNFLIDEIEARVVPWKN